MIIVLDTFPVSCTSLQISTAIDLPESHACRKWIYECEASGHLIIVPALAYYEAVRELFRRKATSQIERLKKYCLDSHRLLPLTTDDLTLAGELWGKSRNEGYPTAPRDKLDADLLLIAQTINMEVPAIVATTNVKHMQRFVKAALWSDIKP